MNARIEAHPEFPFREGREEALGEKARGFLDAARGSEGQQRLLREFVIAIHQYAFLERLIQGEILYDLPIHREVIGDDAGISADEQGERLAAAERRLIGWTDRRGSELANMLEGMGIKILYVEDDRAGDEPWVEPCGAFYFEGEVGPALLVGAPAGSPEASFIAAHEFAHLIADINPYRSRFCRWSPGALVNYTDSVAEARADRFARALLLPDDEVRTALTRFAADNPDADEPMWAELSAVFEVPLAVLHARVGDLGIPVPKRKRRPRARRAGRATHGAGTGAGTGAATIEGDASGTRVGDAAGTSVGNAAGTSAGNGNAAWVADAPASLLALSERFVNLALAAYAERVLDPAWLARFLRTTEENALRMLEWAGISQRPDNAEDD